MAVTPPVFFGRGYVFDRKRRLVSICRRLLRIIPVGKTEIPFSDITIHGYAWLKDVRSATGYGANELMGMACIEMATLSGGRFKVGEPDGGEPMRKILEAIERMGIKVRTADTAPPRRKVKHRVEYIDGEKVIYKHKVWLRDLGLRSRPSEFRRKKLRLTTRSVSIEGLPQIPYASIKRCEIKARSGPSSPYVSLEFADSLGDTKQVKLFHPAFVGSETLPEVESLYNQIMGAMGV